jgi:hypothetical protein
VEKGKRYYIGSKRKEMSNMQLKEGMLNGLKTSCVRIALKNTLLRERERKGKARKRRKQLLDERTIREVDGN